MTYSNARRKSRAILAGQVGIGGEYPISIQSMTNTDPHDLEATYSQVVRLGEAGCDLVRLTAPDIESIETFKAIKKRGVKTPLVADIHFDYRIAVAAAPYVDKIRINPGNIGSTDRVREVVLACREHSVPIRIGVNSGSLEEDILRRHGAPTAAALAESAMRHAAILEELDFSDIAISVKASDTVTMIEANRILAENTNYPLHLGVTEAGFGTSAIVKSSIGIGTLLAEGIGDTVRVSLTDDPTREVEAAREILRSLGLFEGGMEIVSCPTCGRTKIDLISLVRRFEAAASASGLKNKNIKVAIMGCAVNGPGEAREADIGVAGGVGEALLFKSGRIIRKIKEEHIVDELIREIAEM